jgi:NADPH:quinone reductase-like Zn-dependent oxidoreductase
VTADRQRTQEIPPTMRAIRLHAPGGLAQLTSERIETPRPGAGEALLQVHAAAITRGELEWPTDRLPAIPSYELSGVVAAVGGDASEPTVGDAVYALTGFDREGVAADYAVVPSEFLAPKPQALTHAKAAAIPLPALSAWQGLFDHGKLVADERVLIHGATGGVGQFATQLARQRGAHVIATASAGDLDRARDLGAHEVIDGAATRFDEVLDSVDLVFDTVGGERLARSGAVLDPGGRLVSIAEEPATGSLAAGGITALYFVVEPNREQLIELGRLVDARRLDVTIDEVFPLEEAGRAFERSMTTEKRGKVVLGLRD